MKLISVTRDDEAIVKTDGKREVAVRQSDAESETFDVSICRNGWQHTIVTMDREMLLWLRDVLTEQLGT